MIRVKTPDRIPSGVFFLVDNRSEHTIGRIRQHRHECRIELLQ